VTTEIIKAKKIELNGFNFGKKPGHMKFTFGGGGGLDITQFIEWSDRRIIVDLSDVPLEKRDYFIDVTRQGGVESVGMFRLKVTGEKKQHTQVDPVSLEDIGPCDTPVAENLPSLDVMASIPDLGHFTPASMHALGEAAKPFWQASKKVLHKQIACMKDRRNKMQSLAPPSSSFAPHKDYWDPVNHESIIADLVNRLINHYYDPSIGSIERNIAIIESIEKRWPLAEKSFSERFPYPLDVKGFWERSGPVGLVRYHEELINLLEVQELYLQLLGKSLNTWTGLETRLRTVMFPAFTMHLKQVAQTMKEEDVLMKRWYAARSSPHGSSEEDAIERLLKPYKNCSADWPARALAREFDDLGDLHLLPGMLENPVVQQMFYFSPAFEENRARIEFIIGQPQAWTSCQFYSGHPRVNYVPKGEEPSVERFQFDGSSCQACNVIGPLVKRYESRIASYQAAIEGLPDGVERDRFIELVERSRARLKRFSEMKKLCKDRCFKSFSRNHSASNQPATKQKSTAGKVSSATKSTRPGEVFKKLAPQSAFVPMSPIPALEPPVIPQPAQIDAHPTSTAMLMEARKKFKKQLDMAEKRLPTPPQGATSDGNTLCGLYPEPLRTKCFAAYVRYYETLKASMHVFRTSDEQSIICKAQCDRAHAGRLVSFAIRKFDDEKLEIRRQKKLKQINEKLDELDNQIDKLIEKKKRLLNPGPVYLYENTGTGALVEHAGKFFEPKPPLKFVGEKPGKPGPAAKKEITRINDEMAAIKKERIPLLAKQKEINAAFDRVLQSINSHSDNICSESQRETLNNECLQRCASGGDSGAGHYTCM